MSKLDTRAELMKLSHLLNVELEQLAFLQEVPLPALVALREQTAERLFSDGRRMFQRLAMASKLVPVSLSALIAERAFGPMLCGRIASEMPYPRAIELGMKMSVPFLTEVTKNLDPKRIRDIIQNMPMPRTREIAAELIRRKEYMVMGRFVNLMRPEQLSELLPSIPEDALLHIGFYIEGKHMLSDIMRQLPEARLRALVAVMQDNEALWPEALALMVHLEDDLKRRMGDIAAEQNEAMLDTLTRTVHRLDLWKDALPLFSCLSSAVQYTLINMPSMLLPEVLEAVVDNTDRFGLWGTLLPLVEFMRGEQRALLAGIVMTRPPAFREKVVLAAADTHLWGPLLDILAHLDDPAREELLPILRRLLAAQPALATTWRPLAEERALADWLARVTAP